MDSQHVEEFVETLREPLGDALRTVAVGDVAVESYEMVYVSEEIEDLYSSEMRDQIFQDLVIENLVEARQADLFPPLGGLNYTVRVFDGGINVIGWNGDSGVFIGLDEDETNIPSAIAACREELFAD